MSDTDTVPITVGAGASADMAITMTDAPDPVSVGSDLTYSIQVKNNGPFPATTVTMLDVLPTGLSFVSATASQGTCTSTVVLGIRTSAATWDRWPIRASRASRFW